MNLLRKYQQGGDIKDQWGRPENSTWYGFNPYTKQWVKGSKSTGTIEDLNTEIINIGNSFSGGGYNKKFEGSGVPKKIVINDTEVLSGPTNGTYCSGYTCWTALNAMDKKGLLKNMTPEDLTKFQKLWYGVEGYEKGTSESLSTKALETFGLGYGVKVENAVEGDIAQIWRNNGSGHSVIFKDWVKDNSGKIVGIKYRSSQADTNGVGDRTEMFGSNINLDRIYIGRVANMYRKGGLIKYKK